MNNLNPRISLKAPQEEQTKNKMPSICGGHFSNMKKISLSIPEI